MRIQIQSTLNYFNSNLIIFIKKSRLGSLIVQNKTIVMIAVAIFSGIMIGYAFCVWLTKKAEQKNEPDLTHEVGKKSFKIYR